MPERSVVYLDILGFKNYTLLDQQGAAQLLLDYHNIINTKLADMRQFPAEGYGDAGQRRLALAGEVGSFETFLPFSDSIFVISNQPNLFVQQVSSFLIHSFKLTSDAFAHPEDPNDPVTVTMTEIARHGVVGQRAAHWFPLLFRGGIAFNDVVTPQLTTIVEGRRATTTTCAGIAVVNAVGLEKTGKGPRLFCKSDFRDRLNNNSRNLLEPLGDDQHYELLWPAFLYHDSNALHVEINHFTDLFLPAANLWLAFRRDRIIEPHYLEFLKLIIKATLRWFALHNSLQMARDHIGERIAAYDLEELRQVLLPPRAT